MTPEQLKRLQEIDNLDELDAFLQALYDARIITWEEVLRLGEMYGAAIEDAQGEAPLNPNGQRPSTTTISVPQEVLRALSKAQSSDEFITLLGSYLASGEITREQVQDLAALFGVALTEKETSQNQFPTDGGNQSQFSGPLDWLDPSIKASLLAFTSEKDLATRLANLLRAGELKDEATAGRLYNFILGKQPDSTALNKAKANLATEPDNPEYQRVAAQAQAVYDASVADSDRLSGMLIRAGVSGIADTEAKAQADIDKYNAKLKAASYEREAVKYNRFDRQRAWNQAFAKAKRSPYVTEADFQQLNLTPEAMEVYLSSDEATQMMIDRLSGIVQGVEDRKYNQNLARNQQQRENEQFADKQAYNQYKAFAENDLTEKLLTDFYTKGRKVEPRPGDPNYVAPLQMPEAGDVLTGYLKNTGILGGDVLGTGKLRQFAASEIGDVVAEAQPAREQWWNRVAPTLDPYLDYAERQKMLLEEALRFGELKVNSPTALSEWAEKMYYKTLKEREEMKASDYPTRQFGRGTRRGPLYLGEDMEDPLEQALRKRTKKSLLESYYQQPGAGLSPSLTPSVGW